MTTVESTESKRRQFELASLPTQLVRGHFTKCHHYENAPSIAELCKIILYLASEKKRKEEQKAPFKTISTTLSVDLRRYSWR